MNMSDANKEIVTQNRVVKLLCDILGYTYLGDWHDKKIRILIKTALENICRERGTALL